MDYIIGTPLQSNINVVGQIKTALVSLTAMQMTKDYRSHLLQRLKEKFENKITDTGYMIPGTIEIINIEGGIKKGSHFTGQIVHNVKYKAQYYLPIKGAISKGNSIVCQVITINRLGILAQSLIVPSEVVIPRQLQSDTTLSNKDLNFMAKVRPNNLINVKIIDYSIKNGSLIIVGVLVDIISTDFFIKGCETIDDDETKDLFRGIKLIQNLIRDENDYLVVIDDQSSEPLNKNAFYHISQTLKSLQQRSHAILETMEKINETVKATDTVIEDSDPPQVNPVDETLSNLVQTNKNAHSKFIDDIKQLIQDLSKLMTENTQPQIAASIQGAITDLEDIITKFEWAISNDGRAISITNNPEALIASVIDRVSATDIQFIGEYDSVRLELDTSKNVVRDMVEKEQLTLGNKDIWDRICDVTFHYRDVNIKQIPNAQILLGSSVDSVPITDNSYFQFYEIDCVFGITNFFSNKSIQTLSIGDGQNGFLHSLRDRRAVFSKFEDEYTGIAKSLRFKILININDKNLFDQVENKSLVINEIKRAVLQEIGNVAYAPLTELGRYDRSDQDMQIQPISSLSRPQFGISVFLV